MSSRLRIYEAHGVDFTSEHGDEKIGTCPFTGKANKFYVNTTTLLWDSKTAGVGGNIHKFMELVAQAYQKDLTPARLQRFATDRKLPVEAFASWELGWDGTQYTMPVRDVNGMVVDIRRWKLGGRMLSTPGASSGLLGAHHIPASAAEPIYLCEGESDVFALDWLRRSLKKPGVVVGVPGASTMKPEWRDWFTGRVVHTLYDADEAGENGELGAKRKLGSSVRQLTFVHWPDGVHSGFDVRDYIITGALVNKTPEQCWAALHRKFETFPRKKDLDLPAHQPASVVLAAPRAASMAKFTSSWTDKVPTYADVITTFKKWLFIDDKNLVGIEAMLATVVSQEIEGPPIWMFLVAPPGGAKTETLSALNLLPNVYLTSSLTPHALISGANWKGDQDPSLIPRLDGRIMVIKDFTAILAMRDAEKDEIFGILRDAYDGRCHKVFGTGVERNYESRFTILAAVTPRIHDLSQHHHSLGERFLKCTVGDNLQHVSEQDIIRRAIGNINQDSLMKWELQDVVFHFLTNRVKPSRLPDLSESMLHRIIHLGMFTARMRGTVQRDTYRTDIITSRPSAEIGTRLGVQLAKLGKSIALVHSRKTVGEEDYRLVKKVALDTISQRVEDILRTILLRCPTVDDSLSTQELAQTSRYPLATVSRILQDLHILDVVARTGTTYRYQWTVSEYIRNCITVAGLYQTDEERDRPTRMWVRQIKRKAKKKVVKDA
jgi:hypothetical protein